MKKCTFFRAFIPFVQHSLVEILLFSHLALILFPKGKNIQKMAKGKLAKFADMASYPHVFEYPHSVAEQVPI